MKELGILVRWGRVIPGRELDAVELFTEATKFYGDFLAEGALTYFEPFILLSGDNETDNGFFVMKGPAPKIHEIFEGDATLRLKTKAAMILSHLTIELMLVGEEVLNEVTRLAEVGKVLVGTA
jgi:hypothetical protein